MGGVIPKSSAPTPAPLPAPTTVEVEQSGATDMDLKKKRRRGRSPTILTGSAGIQEGATLGTPTLLG
jgi:hypothetical protein